MNKKLVLPFLVLFIFNSHILLFSQSVTYSPYSIFGIGEIETSDLGRYSGMGNVGFGIKSGESLNRLNPASYSGLDSLTFMFEVSMSGKYSSYTNGQSTQSNTMANLKKLAFGFRVSNIWAFSMGLVPYSYMGYKITVSQPIESTPYQFNNILSGNGSINRIYFSNAVSVTRNLSLGINASLLLGTLTHTEEVESALISSTNYTDRKSYLNKFYLDYGFQYTNSIKNNWHYTIGGVFGLENKLILKNTVTMVASGSEIDISEGTSNTMFKIPLFYGAGVSLSNNIGITAAFDYYTQKWSAMPSNSNTFKYVDNNRFSAGIEYKPAIRIPKNYFQRMFYQTGFTYNQSYLKLRGVQINDYSVSAGFGFPIKNDRSYFCISLLTGQRGKIGNDLFKENYYQINFNIVFKDIWFLKSKFD